MKSWYLIALLLVIGFGAHAQDLAEKSVPAVVVNAFQQQFPNPSDVEWEKENDLYKVEFEQNNQEREAWINAGGQVVRQSLEIEEAELPAAVRQGIQRDYNGYRIDEIERMEENGVVSYAVELDNRSDEVEVIYSSSGAKQQ